MSEIPGIEKVQNFINRFGDIGILSTGSTVVNFSGVLYNVSGSTHDPKEVPGHEGDSWKRLLIDQANLGSASCYVTNIEPPHNSSHPGFSVGGHMTTNSDGNVEHGADSYLMPLCYWHNSTARDGEPFQHTQTKMVKLSGYMQGELAATFGLRQPNTSPYALLYFDQVDKNWKYKNLLSHQVSKLDSRLTNNCVLFERSDNTQQVNVIRENTLSK